MSLDELALKHNTDKGSQCHAYTQYYDMIFNKIKNQPLKILEIGVQRGNSLKMWKEYFSNSLINGIDIDPNCKKIEEDRIQVFIGSQIDPVFLKDVKTKINDYIDIIIDDGSHQSVHQIESFNILFPYVRPGGYYVIEDLHTSYRRKHNRGAKITCVKYLNILLDDINLNGKIRGSANKRTVIPALEKNKIELNYNEKNVEYMLMFSCMCMIKKMEW